MAALTARGRGLDCFQPQSRQPVLRQNKLRIFRFRASAKAQSLRLFLLSPQSGHFVGTPTMAGHCVSKQVGRHDAAYQGCPRRVSRSPEAHCFWVVARTVRFSQPAVLSALLVIQLFGIVISPPYFPQRAPKGALRPFTVAALLHYVLWCASEYSVVGRISCHVPYDSIETNVCQWFFAENFLSPISLLNRVHQQFRISTF